MQQPESISLTDWLALLSPAGQQQIVDFVAEARDTRGAGWLAEVSDEFPMARWIVELVATKTADEALAEIEAMYPLMPIRWVAGDDIKSLHARLLAEIDKKR